MISKFLGIGMMDGSVEALPDLLFCLNAPSFGFAIPSVGVWPEIFDGQIVSFDLNPLGRAKDVTRVRIFPEGAPMVQFYLEQKDFYSRSQAVIELG